MSRTIAYDPSSSCGGLALAVDGKPDYIGIWKPSKMSLPPIKKLAEWNIYCRMTFTMLKPDRAVMEVIRVSTSHDTTRSLSRFEAVFIVNAALYGIPYVLEHQVGQARAAFFGEGKGNTRKEDAYAWMVKHYPDLPWLPPDKGGMDQSDALIQALAYDELLKRKDEMAAEKKAARKRKAAAK